jgi:hypothetical protein
VGDAKQIIVKPIGVRDARKIITALHYSHKFDTRSQLHLGVFMGDRCGGAMQFGPSVNKHASRNLFKDAGWNEWIELHRLAFADWLPRNGESRAIGYAMRFIKKTYPHISFVVSYADGAQCGDGTIYRASGFVLTDIKKNNSMWRMPDGKVVCSIVFNPGFSVRRSGIDKGVKARYGKSGSGASSSFLKSIGAVPIPGFQLRYIYFLDPTARDRLTVPILPFSEIERRGAGMYKGIKRVTKATSPDQEEGGGAIPTHALQDKRPKQAMTPDQGEQRQGSTDPDAPIKKAGEP